LSPHAINMTSNEQNFISPRSPTDADLLAQFLPKHSAVVLVCDVVESVRWMEHDEDQAIACWSQFAAEVRERIAPAHEGRVVKSTGDGLMIEFQQAPQAVAAAHALHRLAKQGNERLAAQDPERQLHLRIGIHQAEVRKDAHDLYGHGVNLAARITTLAGPGEIIVTPEVRDYLTDSLDGEVEDMGECYLKHLSEPQRVYKVSQVEKVSLTASYATPQDLFPRMAVLPYRSRLNAPDDLGMGDLIADVVIERIAKCPNLRVISRLSTQAISDVLQLQSNAIQTHYCLSGYFHVDGSNLTVWSQATEISSGQVLWADTQRSDLKDLLAVDSQLAAGLSEKLLDTVFGEVARRSHRSPLPTISSASLMLGGISLLHRSQPQDHEHSLKVFEALQERHPRASDIGAWIGKWYVLNTTRGYTSDTHRDANQARTSMQKALRLDPGNGMAWAMQGFIECHLERDLQAARKSLDKAIEVNPSEPYGWLFLSVLDSFEGAAAKAVEHAKTAMDLAPLDPMRYYLESLAASSHIAAHNYSQAIELCESSLKRNRSHTSTWRAYIAALVGAGRLQQARVAAQTLMRLMPQYSVSQYQRQSVAADLPFGRNIAQALKTAGIPIN
jgi:adenylate cyclase